MRTTAHVTKKEIRILLEFNDGLIANSHLIAKIIQLKLENSQFFLKFGEGVKLAF